ncbi:hypothetical protein CMUS01_16773 [Colletotrichum musicola]|uniref:C2H2-type domain-containing protein n=2 Tax=Colletotrichum orchidearum species complex TaxID=2707337 RepID=A0A8H6ILA5_9PEZI|nr:hypothetical protein CSOJ01_16099 [Colletotrichum sojae]KAF6781467.1 hypothetical protein CMUS01_16773 [Colletotrichum musicola]
MDFEAAVDLFYSGGGQEALNNISWEDLEINFDTLESFSFGGSFHEDQQTAFGEAAQVELDFQFDVSHYHPTSEVDAGDLYSFGSVLGDIFDGAQLDVPTGAGDAAGLFFAPEVAIESDSDVGNIDRIDASSNCTSVGSLTAALAASSSSVSELDSVGSPTVEVELPREVFYCPYGGCCESFTSYGKLREHTGEHGRKRRQRNVMYRLGSVDDCSMLEGPFPCRTVSRTTGLECKRSFASIKAVLKHMRVHHGRIK